MSRLYIDTRGILATVRLIQVDCCLFASSMSCIFWEIELYIVCFNYEWFEIDKVLLSLLQVHLFTLYFKYIFLGVLLLLLE